MIGIIRPVFSAPPTIYDFRLSQGTVSLPMIKAYIDIIGEGDVPAKGLQKEDLKAKIGGTTVRISRLVPFEDAKEGIGYVLLVDVSKSLTAGQFLQMKETLAAFIDAMSELDQAALVTFGSDVKLVQDFTTNRSKIKEKLAVLGPTDEETAFFGGIDKAIAVARSGSAEVPRRRVIIALSDGVNDLTGGVNKGDISDGLSTDPVPLYLIGYFQDRPTAEEEGAIGVMKSFAIQSGGRYYDGRGGGWRGIYFAITRSIRSAFVLEADATGFRSEGATYPFEVSLTAEKRTWSSKLNLKVPAGGTKAVTVTSEPAPPPTAAGSEKSDGIWGGNGSLYVTSAVLFTLFIIGGLWFRRRSSTIVVQKTEAVPRGAASEVTEDQNVPFNRHEAMSTMLSGAGTSVSSGVLIRLMRIHEGPPPHQLELEIYDRVVLGSDPMMSNLVFENDADISPEHCEIFLESGWLYVQNLSSFQGTFLNGALLSNRQRIEEQDILKIGETEMRITFP